MFSQQRPGAGLFSGPFSLVTMLLWGKNLVVCLATVLVVLVPVRAGKSQEKSVQTAVFSPQTDSIYSGHSIFAQPTPLVVVSHQFVQNYDIARVGETIGPIYQQQVQSRVVTESGVLPTGLLYRSYIAAPHEPRMSSVAHYDISKGSWRWDSTLGGRVGLYRQNSPDFLELDAWQIDLEGAVLPRLNPSEQMDVESMDFRFGMLWTGRRDNLAIKFGYFHISSHAGDELLIKNPTFERINFVRESLILGTALQVSPEVRIYGEAVWAFAVRGGAKPLQFQLGAEYAEIATQPKRGAPFTALNIQLREEVDFAAGVTIMSGWQWKGPESGHTLRIGGQYYNGPSNQYQFYQRFDNQIGAGIWFDY